jgi:hypothetical protein
MPRQRKTPYDQDAPPEPPEPTGEEDVGPDGAPLSAEDSTESPEDAV